MIVSMHTLIHYLEDYYSRSFFFLRSWVHVNNTFYYYSHFIYVVMCSISDGGYHCMIY